MRPPPFVCMSTTTTTTNKTSFRFLEGVIIWYFRGEKLLDGAGCWLVKGIKKKKLDKKIFFKNPNLHVFCKILFFLLLFLLCFMQFHLIFVCFCNIFHLLMLSYVAVHLTFQGHHTYSLWLKWKESCFSIQQKSWTLKLHIVAGYFNQKLGGVGERLAFLLNFKTHHCYHTNWQFLNH